ncbi:hypothetical protein SAMN04515667_2738 [Formosa sp. Hel1_31_208]|uniref:sulfotransferase n=1 Tax=Formosa sp. Hel1_31_208 TaxID=1798225 RepID=UPI0008799532|nr:sulfotransferase [Formosa sp. Hel1_31_208]SDS68569.1 hypothetical protein SAMN04515667_2738 [Formosa sp. Hel1_31_208]
MSNKQHKVIVVGLPKTGTSTLAVMLRILNYKVTGPDIHYQFQDTSYLEKQFSEYDAFQDYPWCFEWERYINNPEVKCIILHRDFESWWKSFYDSYGNKNDRYLSFSYMKLSKTEANKALFLDYFNRYYNTAHKFTETYPKRALSTTIKTLEWTELCDFLDEKLPKNILGRLVKKPHVNKQNSKTRKTIKFKILNMIKYVLLKILSQKTYLKLGVFLRKNISY